MGAKSAFAKLDPTKRSNDSADFEKALRRKIVGQDQAIDKVVEIHQMFLAGLNPPGRPIGNLLFLGPTGSGKAQPLSAKVVTPNGFLTMGDLQSGTIISDPTTGGPQKVQAVFPKGDLDIYRITFADGRQTECCDDHLWKVFNKYWTPYPCYKVWSLKQIRTWLSVNPERELFVQLTQSVEYPEKELPLHPYLLGAYLGDGSTHDPGFTSADSWVVEKLKTLLPVGVELVQQASAAVSRPYDYVFNGTTGPGNRYSGYTNIIRRALDGLGLQGLLSPEKFIPEIYKFGSLQQRWELIQGLMDTDGTAEDGGSNSECGSSCFGTTSEHLAKDFQEVIWSLGGICKIKGPRPSFYYNKEGEKIFGKPGYDLSVRFPQPSKLFSLPRKRAIVDRPYQYTNCLRLRIENIESAGKKPAQCILVDSPEHLYLTDGFTVTHNTRVVEAMAEVLFGDARACIKIDCAEFQHSHEIAKLIGSPPGYLGHRETHPILTQEAINQWHTEKLKLSIVLFDEIEKASDSLWQLLLGILDKATLTLGDNRRVDLSNCIIIMTSNLGASEMSKLQGDDEAMGFQTKITLADVDDEKISRSATEAAKKKFQPEFMNRIDKIVVFKTLRENHLKEILEIELGMIQQRVLMTGGANQFVFACQPAVKDFLLKESSDAKYGARHLKRSIEKNLVFPLANLVATKQVKLGDFIRVDVDDKTGELTFTKEAEGAMVPFLLETYGRNSIVPDKPLAQPEGKQPMFKREGFPTVGGVAPIKNLNS